MINPKIFRQSDSRWGRLKYPGGVYTVSRSGCGCVAVTHCAIENPKYANLTPKDVRKFMVQYATWGQGTLWKGITAGLKHYGYTVKFCDVKKTMQPAWDALKGQHLKRGVILFTSGRGPDRTVWTGGGHYIAFVDYKYENKKHWFYLKDSGGRHHDGWYSYEGSMRSCVRCVWVCTGYSQSEKPIDKPKDKYSYTIPEPTIKKGDSGSKVKQLQRFLNWYCNPKKALALDGSFGDKTENLMVLFQTTEKISPDGIFGKQSYTKAIAYLPEKKEEPKKTTRKIIVDVSYWQHKIDWAKASKKVDGAILRASYTGQKNFVLSDDSTFPTNIKQCSVHKVPVGAYHYSQAITEAEAKKEAEYICRKLNNYKKKIVLPVVCDWEFGGRLNAKKAKALGKDKCTKIVCAFCDTVIDYGFIPMVYANYNTFSNYLDYKKLKGKYLIWLAQYSNKAGLDYDYWQYTSSGSVDGIKGKVDLSKAVIK